MNKTPERGNTASAPLASCSCCGNPNKTRINNRIWNFRTPRSEPSSLNDVHSVGNQFRLVYISLLFLPLTALENGKWKSFHKQNSLGLREEIRIARPSGGCPAVWKRVSGQMIGNGSTRQLDFIYTTLMSCTPDHGACTTYSLISSCSQHPARSGMLETYARS